MAMTILTLMMPVRPRTVQAREHGRSQALVELPDLDETVVLALSFEVPTALVVEETMKNRMRTVMNHALLTPSSLPKFVSIDGANCVAQSAGNDNASIAALSCVSTRITGLRAVRRETMRFGCANNRSVAARKSGSVKGYEAGNRTGTGVEAGALRRTSRL